MIEHVARRADLLDAALVHHHDLIGDFERLFLIMRDEHAGHADLIVQATEPLPQLLPHTDARAWFIDKPELAEVTARRNSSLQGAYFMIAARALGLDCGPMSGFDAAQVDHEFFPASGAEETFQQEHFADSHIKSNFLCNLGYGDPSKLFPRSPRLEFDEACRLL